MIRVNVLKVDADQIDEWIKEGRFQQMAHVTAWMLNKAES